MTELEKVGRLTALTMHRQGRRIDVAVVDRSFEFRWQGVQDGEVECATLYNFLSKHTS